MVCGTCLAWKATANGSGECRRAAPMPGGNGAGVFPVLGSEDWCLQWVEREPRP